MPVLDGMHSFLAGVRCLHQYRDFLKDEDVIDVDLNSVKLKKYHDELSKSEFVSEAQALNMFFDLGLNANQSNVITNEEELLSSAKDMGGFPLVLKLPLKMSILKSDWWNSSEETWFKRKNELATTSEKSARRCLACKDD